MANWTAKKTGESERRDAFGRAGQAKPSEQNYTLRTKSGRFIYTSPAKSRTTADSWAKAFDIDK